MGNTGKSEGLEANVGMLGPGSKGKVLLIAAITKYNYFCFRLYFKASMMWCFEIV